MTWLAPHWRLPRRRGPDVAVLGERFVALDLETTGLDPRRDAIVAAAAVPFVTGTPGQGLVTLVNPGRPIPATSTAIHGITDAMVAAAPRVAQIVTPLAQVCGDAVLVGHGVGFDLAVIARERRILGLAPLRNVALDTMRLAAALHPDWADVGLDATAGRLNITIVGRHSAYGDAVAAGQILLALLPELINRGLRTVMDLAWLQDTASPGT
jgi:DNA polymerase III epsilon subunit family exonuclease